MNTFELKKINDCNFLVLFSILFLVIFISFAFVGHAQSLTDFCKNPANASSPACAGGAISPNFQSSGGGSGSGIQTPSGRSGSGIQAPASESTYNQTIKIPNPLKANDISELINRIVNWLLLIGAPMLALMIIIGAFQILTAAGNAEQVTLGRKTITYAVVGYILLLISTGITKIIADLFGAG